MKYVDNSFHGRRPLNFYVCKDVDFFCNYSLTIRHPMKYRLIQTFAPHIILFRHISELANFECIRLNQQFYDWLYYDRY